MIRDRLVELRKKKSLTQEQLANKLGIQRSTYSNYELGKREPDFETAKLLADFFEVTVDYLLNGSIKKLEASPAPDFATSKDKRDLKKMLESSDFLTFNGVDLSDEDREKIQRVMEAMFWDAKKQNKRKKKDDTE